MRRRKDNFVWGEDRVACYYDDPRWEEIKKLHADGEHEAASRLLATVRATWGVF